MVSLKYRFKKPRRFAKLRTERNMLEAINNTELNVRDAEHGKMGINVFGLSSRQVGQQPSFNTSTHVTRLIKDSKGCMRRKQHVCTTGRKSHAHRRLPAGQHRRVNTGKTDASIR